MRRLSHAKAQRATRELFTGGVRPAVAASLASHIAACEPCARLYRRYALLEHELCGAGEAVSVFAIERTKAAVLERAALRDGLRPPQGTAPLVRRRRVFSRLVGIAVPLGALSLAAVLWTLRPAGPIAERALLPAGASLVRVPVSDEFIARGEGAPALETYVGVRLLRVQPPETASEPRVEESTGLSLTDTVTFTYTNVASEIHYLALVGIQAGAVRWYYPGDGETQSRRIEANRVDEPLGDGIRLSVNHTTGPLRVLALFSEEPIDKEAIAALAAELDERGAASVEGARAKPGRAVLEHSFRVTLVPEGSR